MEAVENIAELPDEVIARAFAYLGPMRLMSASVCCRRLSLVACAGSLWRVQLWRLFVFGLSPFLRGAVRFDALELGDAQWRRLYAKCFESLRWQVRREEARRLEIWRRFDAAVEGSRTRERFRELLCAERSLFEIFVALSPFPPPRASSEGPPRASTRTTRTTTTRASARLRRGPEDNSAAAAAADEDPDDALGSMAVSSARRARAWILVLCVSTHDGLPRRDVCVPRVRVYPHFCCRSLGGALHNCRWEWREGEAWRPLVVLRARIRRRQRQLFWKSVVSFFARMPFLDRERLFSRKNRAKYQARLEPATVLVHLVLDVLLAQSHDP